MLKDRDMIPKVIHYCWFGRNPLPPLATMCIESWRKYLPDYEIKEWNEDNFDVNIIPYTREAYQAKKYAFVSDYARFWILYHHGGLYFDTDVELIKPIDDIIAKGPFMGRESDMEDKAGMARHLILAVNPGLGIGVPASHFFYQEMLEGYAKRHFILSDGSLNLKTVVEYTTDALCELGLKNWHDVRECAGIWIYPKEYFCPIDYKTHLRKDTKNTRMVHHFAGSWITKADRRRAKVYKILTESPFFFGVRPLYRLVKRFIKR